MTDNYIHLILKLKQYKNANIANFVYCGKTPLSVSVSNLGEEWNAVLTRFLRLLVRKETSCTKQGEDCDDDVSVVLFRFRCLIQ